MENQETSPAIQGDVRFVGDVGQLFAALALAQAAFQTIVKDSTAKVPGKDGKQGYEFDYAGLDVVLAAVRPALTANGLAVMQVFSGPGADLLTVLAHGESGSRVETRCELPAWQRIQELGSALTYLKRYQLLGLLGVAPADDDDGNAADKNQAVIAPRTKATPPQPKPAPAKEPAKTADPDALTPETRSKIGELGRSAGLNKSDLEAMLARHDLGTLEALNEPRGKSLVAHLEALKAAVKS